MLRVTGLCAGNLPGTACVCLFMSVESIKEGGTLYRLIDTISRGYANGFHYSDAIMIVCSIVCSGADQRKHQSSASLALWGESTDDRRRFSSQQANNAENVSIWWRHHDQTWQATYISCSVFDFHMTIDYKTGAVPLFSTMDNTLQ